MFIAVIKRNINEVVDRLNVIRAVTDNNMIRSKIDVMNDLFTVLPIYYLIKITINVFEMISRNSVIVLVNELIIIIYLYVLVYILRARTYHLRNQTVDIDSVSEGLVRHYKLYGVNGKAKFNYLFRN
jgi:DNA integrity scanning protein DisA with diadenylate cyclase activity